MRWRSRRVVQRRGAHVHDPELFRAGAGQRRDFVGNLPSVRRDCLALREGAHKPADEKAFLNEVRAFARGPYAEALAQGHNLPPAQVDSMAAKVAAIPA